MHLEKLPHLRWRQVIDWARLEPLSQSFSPPPSVARCLGYHEAAGVGGLSLDPKVGMLQQRERACHQPWPSPSAPPKQRSCSCPQQFCRKQREVPKVTLHPLPKVPAQRSGVLGRDRLEQGWGSSPQTTCLTCPLPQQPGCGRHVATGRSWPPGHAGVCSHSTVPAGPSTPRFSGEPGERDWQERAQFP